MKISTNPTQQSSCSVKTEILSLRGHSCTTRVLLVVCTDRTCTLTINSRGSPLPAIDSSVTPSNRRESSFILFARRLSFGEEVGGREFIGRKFGVGNGVRLQCDIQNVHISVCVYMRVCNTEYSSTIYSVALTFLSDAKHSAPTMVYSAGADGAFFFPLRVGTHRSMNPAASA